MKARQPNNQVESGRFPPKSFRPGGLPLNNNYKKKKASVIGPKAEDLLESELSFSPFFEFFLCFIYHIYVIYL